MTGMHIPLKPRTSEKSYALSLVRNTYVFDVPTTVNKLQVAEAVEAQFKVNVVKVRIIVSKGKIARSIRIGSRARANVSGARNDVKKAYVTLKDGDTIPVFAALDEQVAAEQKASKADTSTKSEESKAEPKKTSITSRLGRKKETK